MNSEIRDYCMTWRSAEVRRDEHPSYHAAVTLQVACRKHRITVRDSLKLINGSN